MLKKRIIPCLDVDNGRIVKGVNFVDLIDAGDPVEQAKIYDSEGADELCFLDITATSDNRQTLLDTVQKTAENCFIPLTVGGGVREIKDIKNLLHAGADKVSINTTAVNNRSFVKQAAEKYGTSTIVIAVDAKKNSHNNWEVFTHGGRNRTGINVIDYCQEVESLGAGEILLTSMDRDGTKKGFDNNLMKSISDVVDIPIIASGGAGSLRHLVDGVKDGEADAVLAASIFHYGEYTIQEAKNYMYEHGIEMRL